MRAWRSALPGAGRRLFTSSTSVYAGSDGAEVTEASPADPERETGRILRQTEDETLAAGGAVVRLAGIYGPGRSVLLQHYLTGQSVIDVRSEPPATPDGRWVNQIHREDAAAAMLHLLGHPDDAVFRGQVYNFRLYTSYAAYEQQGFNLRSARSIKKKYILLTYYSSTGC